MAVASPRASGSARIASSAAATWPAAASCVTTWSTAWPSFGLLHELGDRDALGGELLRDAARARRRGPRPRA